MIIMHVASVATHKHTMWHLPPLKHHTPLLVEEKSKVAAESERQLLPSAAHADRAQWTHGERGTVLDLGLLILALLIQCQGQVDSGGDGVLHAWAYQSAGAVSALPS